MDVTQIFDTLANSNIVGMSFSFGILILLLCLIGEVPTQTPSKLSCGQRFVLMLFGSLLLLVSFAGLILQGSPLLAEEIIGLIYNAIEQLMHTVNQQLA